MRFMSTPTGHWVSETQRLFYSFSASSTYLARMFGLDVDFRSPTLARQRRVGARVNFPDADAESVGPGLGHGGTDALDPPSPRRPGTSAFPEEDHLEEPGLTLRRPRRDGSHAAHVAQHRSGAQAGVGPAGALEIQLRAANQRT